MSRSKWACKGRRQIHQGSYVLTLLNFAERQLFLQRPWLSDQFSKIPEQPLWMLCWVQMMYNMLTISKFWVRDRHFSRFAPPVVSLAPWLHFPALCLFYSVISVSVQILLAKFPAGFTWLFFFSLKRRNRSSVLIPASSGKCQIVICWEFAQEKVLLRQNEKKEERNQFVPQTDHRYWLNVVKFCELWPHRTRKENSEDVAGRSNFKNMRVELSLTIWVYFYEWIPRRYSAGGRMYHLI